MTNVVNFGPEFEANLKRVHAEVVEQQAGSATERVDERDLVRQSLEKIASTVPIATADPVQQTTQPSIASEPSSLPSYLSDPSADPLAVQEVQRLIGIVYKDKIEKAISEAKRHPPFVLDALHDALVDKLIPEMKKRGML